jgi:hypothetical protein
MENFLSIIIFRPGWIIRLKDNIPVFFNSDVSVFINESMTRKEFMDFSKDSSRGWNEFKAEKLRQSLKIDFPIDPGFQKSFDFRSEDQAIRKKRVMEGLDPQSISIEAEPAPLLVPESNGKHAVQAMNKIRSFFFIKMNNYFRVRSGFKKMTPLFQLSPKLREIENFAVINSPDALVFISYGLTARHQINYFQTSHPEGNEIIVIETLFIGPPMNQGPGHAPDFFPVFRLKTFRAKKTAQAAHDAPF